MTRGHPTLAELLQHSPSLRPALQGIERAATTDAPVLVLGEPGTGRSALARALHRASRRGDGPLVELDPGSLPPDLFESELFGYRRGAFTGAGEGWEGRVARADRGTLVLDRVEETPRAAQPKLLQLLAEGRYAPLGGPECTADVRFVAIARGDLRDRVRRGVFREDLYFRLEVLAFCLPPLRERLEDLPGLVERLLEELATRQGRSVPQLAEGAREWMVRYSWPGNLRQLRNILERELVLTDGELLDPPPPEDLRSERPRTLVEVEKEEILRALAHTRGHQGRAAELLGISRKGLWEKRRRYGLP